VQRTGIREVVRDDMAVLERLAALADDHTGAGRQWGFGRLPAQFRRTLAGELDYRRELRNLQRFRGLTADYEHIVVPEPLPDYSTSRVLTMEFIEGRKVTDVGPMGLLDVDTEPIVEELFACYLTMILDARVLHVDPHPGNLLLTPDGRIALLDLGMVASVPPPIQTQVVKLLLAISDGNGEETAGVLASMGHPLPGYDAARFREDVAHLVSSAVEMGGGLQAGSVLVELSRLSGEHGLRPPAEMAMVAARRCSTWTRRRSTSTPRSLRPRRSAGTPRRSCADRSRSALGASWPRRSRPRSSPASSPVAPTASSTPCRRVH